MGVSHFSLIRVKIVMVFWYSFEFPISWKLLENTSQANMIVFICAIVENGKNDVFGKLSRPKVQEARVCSYLVVYK